MYLEQVLGQIGAPLARLCATKRAILNRPLVACGWSIGHGRTCARYAVTHANGAFQLMVTSLVDQLPLKST